MNYKKIFKLFSFLKGRGYSIKNSRTFFHQFYLYILNRGSKKYLSRTKTIKNSFSGKRCFIFFTGTSMIDFDFSIIKGENVIGSGMSFIHKDFPSDDVVAYFNPGPWEPRSLDFLDFLFSSIYKKTKAGCHIFVDATSYPYRSEIKSYREKDTYFISTKGKFDYPEDIQPELDQINNMQEGSLPLGLSIANYLGFNEVYLLGQDYLTLPIVYGHFYDGYYEIASNPSDYDFYKKRSLFAIKHFQDKGCKIINVVKNNDNSSPVENITFQKLTELLNDSQ
jgi:hypothetical protein